MSALFSLSQWKDIQIEEFYHPSLQYFIKIVMNCTFAFSCFFFIFTTFVILTQSTTKMETFKITILLQLIFNILYEFMIFLFHPIIHFPLPFISFDGFFSGQVEKIWAIHILAYFLCLIVGGIVALITSLFQRVESIFRHEWDFIHNLILFGYFVLTLFVSASIIVPLYMLFGESDENMQKQIPALRHLYQLLPSTIGVDPNYNPTALWSFIFICCFWVTLLIIAIIGLNLIFILKFGSMKKTLSKETYSLQKMLHRTLIIQLFTATLCILVPLLILVGTFLCQKKSGSWIANLAVPFSSLHMTFDCPCILFFIKPYRKFVLKLFGRRNHRVMDI